MSYFPTKARRRQKEARGVNAIWNGHHLKHTDVNDRLAGARVRPTELTPAPFGAHRVPFRVPFRAQLTRKQGYSQVNQPSLAHIALDELAGSSGDGEGVVAGQSGGMTKYIGSRERNAPLSKCCT